MKPDPIIETIRRLFEDIPESDWKQMFETVWNRMSQQERDEFNDALSRSDEGASPDFWHVVRRMLTKIEQ